MSLEANAAGHHPEIAPTAYLYPTATVIGRVCVGDRGFVGPHAAIRADEAGLGGTIEPIVISECANVQDCAVTPSRRRPRVAHHCACYWRSAADIRPRWIGFPSFHRADARRRPRGNHDHRECWGKERRLARDSDPCDQGRRVESSALRVSGIVAGRS
jgi:hypothetical protein